MVLILDGSSEHVTHAYENDRYFRFVLDLNKCLKQIKYQRLYLPCAPISELPTNKSTMISLVFIVNTLLPHWTLALIGTHLIATRKISFSE